MKLVELVNEFRDANLSRRLATNGNAVEAMQNYQDAKLTLCLFLINSREPEVDKILEQLADRRITESDIDMIENIEYYKDKNYMDLLDEVTLTSDEFLSRLDATRIKLRKKIEEERFEVNYARH